MLKIGVIGLGNMGKHHVRVCHELNNIKLIGISDLDETKKNLAEQYNCKFFKTPHDLIDDVDAVIIAVPTHLHKKIAIDCITLGKHVLLEKPIADNEADAQEIIDSAKKNNVKLQIGHIERFNPVITKLKELLDNEELGEITSLSAKRVGVMPPQIKDANVIIDLAVHDIDIFNYILNKEPDEIECSSGHALLSTRDDYADIFLKYGNTGAFVQVNWITPVKIRQLSITGTKGYLELNYLTQEITLFKTNYERQVDNFGDSILKFGNPDKRTITVKKEEPLKNEINSFISSITNNTEVKVTGESASLALKIALHAIGMKTANVYIDKTAKVSEKTKIGKGSKIWRCAQIREHSEIGENTIISKNVYVDYGVKIGKNVKIQNNVSVYHGVTIEDGVFIGPHVCFTNDKLPRAINPDGTLKRIEDWTCGKTKVEKGATLGANSTILTGITIGEFSLIGAGATVTKDIPAHGLVIGSPAKLVGYVCYCGRKLIKKENFHYCENCKTKIKIKR